MRVTNVHYNIRGSYPIKVDRSNSFQVNVTFLYRLRGSENLRRFFLIFRRYRKQSFPGVFRGYSNEAMTGRELD